MFPPPRVVYSVILFSLVMAAVVVTRPSLFFLPDGSVRPFGIEGGDATPFPLGAFVVLVAVCSMFLFSTVDLAYANARHRTGATFPAAPGYYAVAGHHQHPPVYAPGPAPGAGVWPHTT